MPGLKLKPNKRATFDPGVTVSASWGDDQRLVPRLSARLTEVAARLSLTLGGISRRNLPSVCPHQLGSADHGFSHLARSLTMMELPQQNDSTARIRLPDDLTRDKLCAFGGRLLWRAGPH